MGWALNPMMSVLVGRQDTERLPIKRSCENGSNHKPKKIGLMQLQAKRGQGLPGGTRGLGELGKVVL